MNQDIYLSMGRGAKAMVADAIDIRRALERRTILHPGKFPLWSGIRTWGAFEPKTDNL